MEKEQSLTKSQHGIIIFRLDLSIYLSYNLAMPEWIGKTIGNVRIDKLLARGGNGGGLFGLASQS